MLEQQALCEDAARRKDAQSQRLAIPAAEGRRHVRKNLSDERPSPISIFPDPALKLFERRGLHVAVHQPFHECDSRCDACVRWTVDPRWRRLAALRRGMMLATEALQDRGVVVGGGMLFEVRAQMLADVREEDLGDERQRCRRALDIQQHGLGAVGKWAHAGGCSPGAMYPRP